MPHVNFYRGCLFAVAQVLNAPGLRDGPSVEWDRFDERGDTVLQCFIG
jgi:hypothetical protein